MDTAKALSGLKVVDLSWVIVGPLTAKCLADHGATVVRIESDRRPDMSRTTPAFKDNIAGLNRSHYHANFNSSKYSISLDLTNPQGLEIAKKLIAWADILIEGFVPGVAEKLGLGYEEVRVINPDIIMLRTTGYGQDGPYARVSTLGIMLASPFHFITGWPDRNPVTVYGAYTDFIAPSFNVAAIMAAIDYRRRTGKGQLIDSSQYEMAIQFLSPLLLDYQVNGTVAGRCGNRSSYAVPHGVYPCKSDDRWCTISITDDKEWHNFVEITDLDDLKDKAFATFESRKKNESHLDELIGQWTIKHTPREVMTILQERGIAAGIISDIEDVFNDPQLQFYHYFQTMIHSEMGEYSAQNVGFMLSDTPRELRKSAPCLGEDTEFVCTEILGLSDDEFVELYSQGVFFQI